MKHRVSPVASGLALLVLPCIGLGCEERADTQDRLAGLETLERVVENPAAFAGRSIVIAGEVERVYDNRAFTMGGDDFFDQEILVVSREPLPAAKLRDAAEPLWQDDIVQVNGTVRMLVVGEIERELGWDLAPQIEAEFTQKPILIASSVAISPRERLERRAEQQSERVDEERQPVRGEEEGKTARKGLAEPVRSFTIVLATEPIESLVGKKVELADMKVRSVVSDRGFWVGPSHGRQLFVRLDPEPKTPKTPIEGKVDVNAGQTVTLKGTLREIPDREALESKWGLSGTQAELVAGEPFYLEAIEVNADGSQAR